MTTYSLINCGAERATLRMKGGHIEAYGAVTPEGTVYDAQGGAVLPGLIDSHTHFVFAGDRLGEFAERSRGATYEEITKAGGGIWKTVLATRAASEDELVALARPRLSAMLARGVTTVECKGGYGLTLEDERKILRAARFAGDAVGVSVVTTFLALHTLPRGADKETYVADSIHWLEQLHSEGLVDGVDVFVESTAFSADHARKTAAVAKRLGLPVRLHVDQLTAGAGAELCAELSAVSADHLEHMNPAAAALLAKAAVVANLLPFATLYVGRGAKPPVAALRAAGVKMAVSTDFNPGSAPVLDLHAAMALSVGYLGLTVKEALAGVTEHAAAALALPDRGTLAPGMRADVIVLDHADPARLVYELGRNPIRAVFVAGNKVAQGKYLG